MFVSIFLYDTFFVSFFFVWYPILQCFCLVNILSLANSKVVWIPKFYGHVVSVHMWAFDRHLPCQSMDLSCQCWKILKSKLVIHTRTLGYKINKDNMELFDPRHWGDEFYIDVYLDVIYDSRVLDCYFMISCWHLAQENPL